MAAPPPHLAPPLKVIVFDDDPTGSQTVHGCLLLLRWDPGTLLRALRDPSPLLFLLTDTRALEPEPAADRVRQICRALRPALAAAGIERWLVVSRGDSTLRGHTPLEAEVIAAELGPFDATLLVPAFLEGGRTTVAGCHLLHGEPVHRTPFARDRRFGYGTSVLRDWLAEKSGGRLLAQAVQQIGLAELVPTGREALIQRLRGLSGNPWLVVDAERAEQLQVLGDAVRAAVQPAAGQRPQRLLFQSAASLLNALVDVPPQPLSPAALAGLRRRPATGPLPGLVLVGSHVPLADAQLERLLAAPGCGGVEIPVARVARALEGPLPDRLLPSLEAAWLAQLRAVLASGRTPVLFTSRGELVCRHAEERRALGLALAAAMARLGGTLAPQLGYLISKGGITSQTLLADGLGLRQVRLEGQLLPGLSMLRTGAEHATAPLLPLLTFPGNLGQADTLRQAWEQMEQ